MDEVVLSVTAFGGAIFAAGLAFGGLIAYLILPGERRARRLETELEQARKEASEYKTRVSGHFHRTAELVSGLTNSYKAVYDHLAGGARELAEAPDGSPALAFADPKLLVEQDAPIAAPAEGAQTQIPREGDADAVAESGQAAAAQSAAGRAGIKAA